MSIDDSTRRDLDPTGNDRTEFKSLAAPGPHGDEPHDPRDLEIDLWEVEQLPAFRGRPRSRSWNDYDY